MSQVSTPTKYLVEMDVDKAREMADAAGARNERERAEHFGLSEFVWSRLTNSRRPTVTAGVISRTLKKRQELCFDDLFHAVTS